MKKLHDVFFVNAKPYLQLNDVERQIIDMACKKLCDWESVIMLYENKVLNIITEHPNHSLFIQSEFPDDLTGKMVFAFANAKASMFTA